MNTKLPRLVIALALLALATLNPQFSTAFAQGTAFTYQGRLNSGSAPANGNYDVVFALYNDPLLGSQVGSAITNSAVPVTNGLFTTTIDFGGSPWTGQLLYLQMLVRTNGNGALTLLAPRQQVTPAPYSILAANAGSANSVAAANISGTILNASLPISPSFSGTVTAGTLAGNGGGLTNLNASQLTSGMVSPGVLPGFQGPYYSTIGGGYGNNNNFALGATVGGGIFNTNGGYAATIAGGDTSTANGSHATVGGGGNNGGNGDYSTVDGGSYNVIDAGGDHSAIGGGIGNHIVGYESTIAGGYVNLINGQDDVIAGGDLNVISVGANRSFIGGGINNTNTGSLAVIPGGDQNVATNNSFAAGHRAKAVNQGAFIWADSQDADFSSTANNQFLIRAQGGVGINMNNPKRRLPLRAGRPHK